LKKGDNKLKNVTYFYADISNDGFAKNPVFLQYLKTTRKCNAFIKSASYLSHYETFSNIRDLVLDKADAVLEDDTGIPYRYFLDDYNHYLTVSTMSLSQISNQNICSRKILMKNTKQEM
jgi:hypothetical protein